MDEGRPPDPAPVPETAVPAWPPPADTAIEEVESVDPVEAEPIVPKRPGKAVVAVVVTLIGALIVFAVVGGRILAGPGPASAGSPRLAVTDRGGKLYTMNSQGGDVAAYTIPVVEFGFPAWSPDGSRIAVTAVNNLTTAIDVIDAADTGQTKPTVVYESSDKPPFYLYWSPDGRQIAFLTTEGSGIALRVAPADGPAPPTVVREGAPFYWDWLGNDHLVAHIGLSGEGSFLGELDLRGTSGEAVPLSAGLFRSPAVSRDGAHRAYVTTGTISPWAVTVESADRSSRETAPAFGIAAVAFDPTSETLAYVAADRPIANDPGFPLGPLRTIDPATGKTRTLLSSEVVGFFWSPDGKTIAALTLTPPGDEVVGVPGAGLASATRPFPGADQFLPDAGVGLTLVFVDVASGKIRAQRPVSVTSRYVNNILPYYDQYALSHRTWSPDSSAIALPLDKAGQEQRYVIPADGSEPTPLDGAEVGFWSP